MAKVLDYNFELPYSPEAMFQEGIRRDYIEAQAKSLNHHDLDLITLENGPDGGAATAKYDIDVELPGWAAKILQPRNRVTEYRTWSGPEADGSRAYSFSVKLDTVPVEVKGEVRLDAVPEGTSNQVHIEIRSGLPLFGGKLEELVARDLGKTIEAEAAYMVSWMEHNEIG